MDGICYGIGTGPGDPELLTIKAVKTMLSCDVIALPISDRSCKRAEVGYRNGEGALYYQTCLAYRIAEQAVPNLKDKLLLYLPMPMTKDRKQLKEAHEESANAVLSFLAEGKQVGFLTIGDPSVYSTYLYVAENIKRAGGRTEMISGVPSFCAAAAAGNMALAEQQEQIHIIPASYGVEEAVRLPGTKILMKAGRKMEQVKDALLSSEESGSMECLLVENCGLPQERICRSLKEIPEQAGYYSLLILKEKR